MACGTHIHHLPVLELTVAVLVVVVVVVAAAARRVGSALASLAKNEDSPVHHPMLAALLALLAPSTLA